MKRVPVHRQARALLAVAIAALVGCSQAPQRLDGSADLPKQLRGQQVVVTLPEASSQQWEATKQALASQYELRATGSFPLSSIRVGCVVFEVPPERHIDEVVRSAARATHR